MEWGFYGRQAELEKLSLIFQRNRWFFAKITGRRRIGKTRLIQEALKQSKRSEVFYVQIPDSAPSGVITTVAEAIDTFSINTEKFSPPKSLLELSKFVAALVRSGYIVVLDEFQYFNRPRLKEFCSYLQSEVDVLNAAAQKVPGGLFVLGSIHTEMMAILEDRSAPLYNRITDEVHISHWDNSSLIQIFNSFGIREASQFLFFWSLFEGIPKFYRDCFEQGVLGADRKTVLKKMFFDSSSPLRTEADNWFLKELHGRYDTVLKYVARHAGCSHSDLIAYIRSVSSESEDQVGGYLQTLLEKYQIIEKRLPIFASPKARKGRYYIADNFLRSWLGALSAPVAALNFSPLEKLVEQADQRLMKIEGYSLEKLVASLYEERSKKSVGNFQLTERIQGYWDRSDCEIDLVALDRDAKKIRFGTCKRSSAELLGSICTFRASSEKFLSEFKEYQAWTKEYFAISPAISKEVRLKLADENIESEDFSDLFKGL